MDIALGAWDLRHLLLSLEDTPRHEVDGRDLGGVVGRAVAALSALPPRPPIAVPGAPVEGLPLWILETNAWIIAAGRDCVVVDVPPAPAALVARLRRRRLRPVGVVLTHGHPDHTGGTAALLEAFGGDVPVYVHPADRERVLHPGLDGVLARSCPEVRPVPAGALVDLGDGDTLALGPLTLRARHVPGHTAGSTCVLVEGGTVPLLVTGDTLFAGGTGRCDLPGGSRPLAEASLRRLLAGVPAGTIVLPGHGGTATVGPEAVSGPTLAA